VLPTFFQFPEMRRWILTGTLAVHAVNPSPTLTTPLARRCFFRLSVTLLGCVLLTVKLVVLVAEPPGVVTLIGPVVAVEGTVAVIWVAEFTTNVAVTLLKVTEVVVKPVPLKFVPVIFTCVPTGPKVGVKDVIVGVPTTVKSVVLVAVPLGFVTLILPVVAPVGTVAVIDVAEFTVNEVAFVVLNLTTVVPQNFVPVIVTLAPIGPAVGVNELMVGAAGAVSTTKSATLAVSASGVRTVILPVVAPVGTAAVTVVSVRPVSVGWLVPLKSTSVAPVNAVPVIATDVPTTPHLGMKFVTVDADAGRAVSPTINVIPTSGTNTRTNARFPTDRPRRFMASTSLSSSTSSRLHFHRQAFPEFHLAI
jgi:hypothetical protein